MAPTLRSFALLALFGSLATSAAAEPERMACPAGQRPGISGCVDGSPRARPSGTTAEKPQSEKPQSEKPQSEKRVPRPDPALSAERAKPTPAERQSRTLLVRELKRLEAMLKTTPENSPDFPVILRRLAEGYAELEAVAERERAKAQAAADDAERAPRESPPPKRTLIRGSGTIL